MFNKKLSFYVEILRRVLIISAAVAVAVVTFGVLAIPVVLSVIYSWCWLFLYVGYAVIALLIAVAPCNSQTPEDRK